MSFMCIEYSMDDEGIVELPKGKICLGCRYLEFEFIDERGTRGWCILGEYSTYAKCPREEVEE